MMTNKAIAEILQDVLQTSTHPEWFDDNIQPSKRRHYDGDRMADRIEMLIKILQLEENK